MIKNLTAIYFSGTGNTKWAVERLCKKLSAGGVECTIKSIEDSDCLDLMANADAVLVAYPIYGSDLPPIMKEWLKTNASAFYGKKIITLATQLLFSGDGGALAKRMLRKQKVKCAASIHVNLPSNICDLTIFKIKNGDENAKKITKAKRKIDKCATKILQGKRIINGRHFYSWGLGFFTQRCLHKLFMERRYKKALKIDESICVKCNKCAECCPINNIVITDTITTNNNCTACYRCVNLCPVKAISLMIKKKPKVQYKGLRGEHNN